MSFFRVLLALLISAGIAYGLYIAVDERRFDRAVETVEAVRTEIVSRTGAVLEEVTGQETVDEEIEVPAQGETMVMERAEPADTAEEPSEAVALTDEAEGAQAGEEATPADTEVETESTGFAARIEQDAAAVESADATDTGDADLPAQEVAETVGETADPAASEPGTTTQEASDTVGENDVPRIAAMPAPPETVLPDEAQVPSALETQDALPAARIADEVDTSTDALDVVSGGMNYAEARETMIEAGWSPRLPATRTGGPNEAENAMIEAGYGELEGCNGDDRPICRFEFVDGENRIAAVLTAGTGADPSVIDAFLMNIRAE